ncbi:hypothetical protein C6P43_000733 [Kluyveromyces marxianus]|nr:hypothetical protein C6P43_000733 [Kluyveromyces marxianus]
MPRVQLLNIVRNIATMTAGLKQTYVGSLACQRNSFLSKDFVTTVVACNPGKKKNTYEVELEDTILFPEGGGQPSDSGRIHVENGEVLSVSSVFRRGLHAVHVADKDINPGTKVTIDIDWTKRLDYMQQHTGQHLVSAILEQKWNLKTLSWSMGGVPSEKKPHIEPYDLFNYLEIGRALTAEEVQELTETITKYITVDPKNIEILEGDPESHEEVSTHKVPDDYDLSKGVLRVVKIGNLDKNPCCGTHLQSTSQISSVLILPKQSSVRGTNSRLYFMCGDRVRRYALFANETLSATKKVLSCSDNEIVNKCETTLKNLQKATKREQYWIKELAQYSAKPVVETLQERSKAHLIRDEFGTLEFLIQAWNAINQQVTELSLKDYCYVLIGRERVTSTGAVLIISDSGEKIQETSNSLKAIVSQLKGGGGKNGGKWQGKVSQFKDNEFEELEKFLQSNF